MFLSTLPFIPTELILNEFANLIKFLFIFQTYSASSSSKNRTVEDVTKAVSSSLTRILSLLPTLVRIILRHSNPFNGGSSKGTSFKEFRNELREAAHGESLALYAVW